MFTSFQNNFENEVQVHADILLAPEAVFNSSSYRTEAKPFFDGVVPNDQMASIDCYNFHKPDRE